VISRTASREAFVADGRVWMSDGLPLGTADETFTSDPGSGAGGV
jgi:hypothetical protein